MAALSNGFPDELNCHILSLELNMHDPYRYFLAVVSLKITSKYLLGIVRRITKELSKIDDKLTTWILNKAISVDNIGVYMLIHRDNLSNPNNDLFFINESYKCWRYAHKKLPRDWVIMQYIRGMYKFYHLVSLEQLLNEHNELFIRSMCAPVDNRILGLILIKK